MSSLLHPLPLIEPERICLVRHNHFPFKIETVLFLDRRRWVVPIYFPLCFLSFSSLYIRVKVHQLLTCLLVFIYFFSTHIIPLKYSFWILRGVKKKAFWGGHESMKTTWTIWSFANLKVNPLKNVLRNALKCNISTLVCYWRTKAFITYVIFFFKLW